MSVKKVSQAAAGCGPHWFLTSSQSPLSGSIIIRKQPPRAEIPSSATGTDVIAHTFARKSLVNPRDLDFPPCGTCRFPLRNQSKKKGKEKEKMKTSFLSVCSFCLILPDRSFPPPTVLLSTERKQIPHRASAGKLRCSIRPVRPAIFSCQCTICAAVGGGGHPPARAAPSSDKT